MTFGTNIVNRLVLSSVLVIFFSPFSFRVAEFILNTTISSSLKPSQSFPHFPSDNLQFIRKLCIQILRVGILVILGYSYLSINERFDNDRYFVHLAASEYESTKQ